MSSETKASTISPNEALIADGSKQAAYEPRTNNHDTVCPACGARLVDGRWSFHNVPDKAAYSGACPVFFRSSPH